MRYFVKVGLAGYGPDLDVGDSAVDLEDLDAVLSDELAQCAEHCEDSARALAESGDFESAWREHERAESLSVHSANFSPSRRDAPMYKGNLPLWLDTVKRQVEETFPLDVGNHERLYVWEEDHS